jgi:MFS family permease
MKPLSILAGLMVAGAALSVYDLLTGWMIPATTWAAPVVGFGLFFGALAVLTVAAVMALRDRRHIRTLVDVATRIRWSSVLAAAFAVLLFADCSGASGSYQTGHSGVGGPMADPTRYWLMATGLLLPTLILLALPGITATVAERRQDRRWAHAGIYAAGAAAIVAFITAPIALVFGVSACDFGTSTGMCAAGVGGIANGFTIGALALFLPYLTLLPAFLPRQEKPPPQSP